MDYINGCAILIRRAAAEAAGALGPLFFICVDDADFCTRAKRQGLPLRLRAPRRPLPHGRLHDRRLQPGAELPVRPEQRALRPALRPAAGTGSASSASRWPPSRSAYLRELRQGNQAAAVAKLQGLREGLKTDLRPRDVLEARDMTTP